MCLVDHPLHIHRLLWDDLDDRGLLRARFFWRCFELPETCGNGACDADDTAWSPAAWAGVQCGLACVADGAQGYVEINSCVEGCMAPNAPLTGDCNGCVADV